MANEIRGDIVVRGADKAGRDLKNVGDSAAKAGGQMEELEGSAKGAGTKLGDLGKASADTKAPITDLGDGVGYLDSEVQRLEVHLKDLIKQLDATGDTSLLKDIRKDKRQLATFAKLAKEIAPETAVSEAGAAAGSTFAASLIAAARSVATSGGPVLTGALVAAAVAATPLLGATIAGAVLGGAGAGGIVGGIALAAKDARVQAAAATLGAEMMHSLEPIGKAFAGPAVDSLEIFRDAVADIAATAAPGFAELAKEVAPLARSLAGMAENAMPGFLKAIEAAKPVLHLLEEQLPEIGAAVSDMFESFAEGGDGAVMALDVLLDGVKGTLITFGDLVSILGQTYEWLVRAGIAVGDAADEVASWSEDLSLLVGILPLLNNLLQGQVDALDRAGVAGKGGAIGVRDYGEEAKRAAEEIQGMTDAVSDFLGIQMSVDEANLRWAQGLIEVRKELRDGKRDLRENTEEGGRNREALLGQIEAADRVRQAAIAQGNGTKEAMDVANEAYRKNVQELYNMAKAAGFNKAELDKMFAPYLNGPRIAVTEFQFPGLLAGLARARELARLLGSNVAAVNQNDPYAPGRASGGPVQAGQPYMVGEEGPELIVPGQSGTVLTTAKTKALMSGSGSSGGMAMGGGGGIGVQLSWSTSMPTILQTLADALTPYIQISVSNQGGSAQAVLGDPRMAV